MFRSVNDSLKILNLERVTFASPHSFPVRMLLFQQEALM